MIKQLCLKPKSALITELQSDTIYGHFCWRLKEKLGEKKLADFIALYKNGGPVFLLSNGLLKSDNDIYLPTPYLFDKPQIKEKKKDKILDFINRKQKKESPFLSLKQFNKLLNGTRFDNLPDSENKDIIPGERKHLHVKAQIDRKSLTAAQGKLFSYNPRVISKGYSYVIFIKILYENHFNEYQCEQIFKDVFTLGFGKKKSSGYGHFEDAITLNSFSGFDEPEDHNAIVVLGNYLPSDKDGITPIGYNINVKHGKFGEELAQSENPFKNPITFLTAGSCFKTSNKQKNFYGRISDEGEISEVHRKSVQFGCPFFLRMKT